MTCPATAARWFCPGRAADPGESYSDVILRLVEIEADAKSRP
jgi:hypothetical protein